jgi:CrcB protein
VTHVAADGEGARLPIDVDSDPFAPARRPRGPRLRLDVLAAVFAGGCLGGVLRYLATSASHAPAGGFPWATLAVNLAGAFVLAVVVVVATDLAPSRYLRPLIGTGFCGGLTTFSSVVVAVDQMLAHHRAATALLYLFGTIAGGLAAAWLGLVAARVGTARVGTARRQPERSAR